jgi:hypothetical protein
MYVFVVLEAGGADSTALGGTVVVENSVEPMSVAPVATVVERGVLL